MRAVEETLVVGEKPLLIRSLQAQKIDAFNPLDF